MSSLSIIECVSLYTILFISIRLARNVRAFEFSFSTHSSSPPSLFTRLRRLFYQTRRKALFQPRQRKSADPSGLSKLLPFAFCSRTTVKMFVLATV